MKHLCGVPGCTNKSEWFRTHTVISDTIIEDNEFLDRFIKKGVCDAHIREFNSIYQYGVLFPAGVVEISSESHLTCAFNDCTEEPKWACPAVSLFDLHPSSVSLNKLVDKGVCWIHSWQVRPEIRKRMYPLGVIEIQDEEDI